MWPIANVLISLYVFNHIFCGFIVTVIIVSWKFVFSCLQATSGIWQPNRIVAFTPGFRAPEIDEKAAFWTATADWYSFGCTLAAITVGKYPQITSPPFCVEQLKGVEPALLKDLIEELLIDDPALRLGGSKGEDGLVLTHKYLAPVIRHFLFLLFKLF